jgi:hypothetical protein
MGYAGYIMFELGEADQLLCHARDAIAQSQGWLCDYLLRKKVLQQRQEDFDSNKFHWQNPPKSQRIDS